MNKNNVSVIIPVLNAADLLKRVLHALSEQTYPLDQTEIIVVDNGSSDSSVEVARSFGATVFSVTDRKSPYAARNLGFEHASGSIIALTDANKIPDRQWLEEGIDAITSKNLDLAGGKIAFELGENPSSAEICDAITYNDNRMFVTEQKSSAAGNLFFRKELLEHVGKFPDTFRSGMDIWWTGQAVKKGYKIVYAEKAVVYCQPRKLRSLLKKSHRIGVLHPVTFRQQGRSIGDILRQTIGSFFPPRSTKLRKKLESIEHDYSYSKIWVISWLMKIMMGVGRIQGLHHLRTTINSPDKPNL